MSDKKNCFIIMPITTPDEWLPKYRNDKLHFHHVLDYLFLPSIELAGLNPIKPIAEGADNIPAEIIKNLNDADLVLCDLSIFNPNVFFELGIRTALDKPICMVKDEHALRIPFDVSIINCHNYKSLLEHWDMEQEILNLSNHLKESLTRSNNRNPLWKYFGIRSVAKSLEGGSESDKIELLLNKLDKLYTDKFDDDSYLQSTVSEDILRVVEKLIWRRQPKLGFELGINFFNKTIKIFVKKIPPPDLVDDLIKYINKSLSDDYSRYFKIEFVEGNVPIRIM